MDRIYALLNIVQEKITSSTKFKTGDKVKNVNSTCKHYGSEGVVDSIEQMPDDIGYIVGYKTTNAGLTWTVDQHLKKTEDQLVLMDSIDDTGLANDDEMEDTNRQNDEESELTEYKEDFYEMSLGSLRAIAQHAQNILNSLDSPTVKENLTESWLQGKIAVTEDYMLTIHNFLMFGETETDTEGAEAAKNLPGLWENIRRKREREGKNYKPAKPGDKDRPDSEQWKKLSK